MEMSASGFAPHEIAEVAVLDGDNFVDDVALDPLTATATPPLDPTPSATSTVDPSATATSVPPTVTAISTPNATPSATATATTVAGTRLLKDVNPTTAVARARRGSASSNPDHLTVVGGVFFFTADDGARGTEPWKSDGTEAGTVLVKDIRPGPASCCSYSAPGDIELTLWNVDGTAFLRRRRQRRRS
ncbi:MAG: hypothetical protein HYV63_03430 [Candidatus Schekmanbacteria bacterium]|nr:hypothetical protein [Candidatus Schekmanbacteria bacterium]